MLGDRSEKMVGGAYARPLIFVSAGPWRRLGAFTIDLVIAIPAIAVATRLFLWVADLPMPELEEFWSDQALDMIFEFGGMTILVALSMTIYGCYRLVLISYTGTTPGLRLFSLRLIDHYGRRPSLGRAAFRALAALMGIVLLGSGIVWIAIDRKRRALHDIVSGTYLVQSARRREQIGLDEGRGYRRGIHKSKALGEGRGRRDGSGF